MALTRLGPATDRFFFEGFAIRTGAARTHRSCMPATLVLFERRAAGRGADLADGLGARRPRSRANSPSCEGCGAAARRAGARLCGRGGNARRIVVSRPRTRGQTRRREIDAAARGLARVSLRTRSPKSRLRPVRDARRRPAALTKDDDAPPE
jgi:hypothetical protein